MNAGPRDTRSYDHPRWTPPTRRGRILVERREPVVVDLLGRTAGAITYDMLGRRDREHFDAQLTAWRAGVALVAAADHSREFGTTISPDAVAAWETARDEYHFERVTARNRKGRR